MNYKIIKDEKILNDFISWLPILQEQEKYYLCLFARSKYTKDATGTNGLPHIKSDKAQLKRFLATKENMYQKIKQLEIEVGWYKQKELIVPEEALALYITVNPRDLWKATHNSLVKLATCLRDSNKLNNPHQEVLSEIQRSKSRTCYIDFDIDETDEEELGLTMRYISKSVNVEAITWLKTRGGVHCLINPDKIDIKYKNTFYKDIKALKNLDQTGDQMIPVPGVTQGMFVPHFINL